MKKRIKLITMTFLLLFVLSGFFSLILGENVFVVGGKRLLRMAGVYTEAIPSVTINQDGYTNQTPGTYGITKSAKWTGFGKAEVIFDVKSIAKASETKKDIILVLDISGSMSGEKLNKVKEDSKELVGSVLSDPNNKIALITFDTGSEILSSFTNNKTTLLNQIDSLTTKGTTNYHAGLKNIFNVIEEKYIPIEYIESNGTQWIDTLLSMDSKYTFEVEGLLREGTMGVLINGYSSTSARQGATFFTGSNKMGYYWFGKGHTEDTTLTSKGIDLKQKFKVVQNKSGITITQGSNSSSSTYSGTNGTDSQNIHLFHTSANANHTNGVIYSAKIKDGNTLVRDFIPVMRQSDGTIGLWDKVEKKFYTNSGTGTFLKGSNLSEEAITIQNNSNATVLFLTDGQPCEDIHNEIAMYEILKDKYPDMTIQGIQYEMGSIIKEDLKKISDNQFHADMTTLENVLFEASIVPYIYENFVITDYIHDDYFTVGSVDDIKVPYGTVQLVPEGNGQKVIWDLSGLYRTGSNVQMKINLTLKQQYVGGEEFYPTNKKETITSQLPEEEIKTKNSDLTPVLQSHYQVIYDSNVPTGCTNQDLPTEKHAIYEAVEKKDTELICPGYQFKGWELDLNDSLDIQKINNDVFIMPEHDVTIRGQWTKHNIEKSMDGTIHVVRKVTNLYTDGTLIINDEDIDNNITKHGAIVKEYPGFSDEQQYTFTYTNDTNNTILWYNEREQIKKVEIGEVIQPTSTAYWFNELRNMESGDFTNLDTSKVTDMHRMFYNAGRNATTWNIGDLSGWDTSKVTSMGSMFYNAGRNATTWNIGDLSGWDTSKVTSMGSMFSYAGYNATTWSIGDLSNWDTSKVTSMGSMFESAGRNATTWNIGDLSNWDTSSVTYMSSMFENAGRNATTWDIGNLSNWDVSNVEYMREVFFWAGYNASIFDIGDLSDWNTSKVRFLSQMFSFAGYNATVWNVGSLSNWDVSNVTEMTAMFESAGVNATTFNLDLSNWDVSNVIYMNTNTDYLHLSCQEGISSGVGMFHCAGRNATTWSIGDLSNWDTSSVTSMNNMFSLAGSKATTWDIGDLSKWDTSSVTRMKYMFYGAGYTATTFDIGDLSGWDTSQVETMDGMFYQAGYKATTWNIGNLSKWDTSSVTRMKFMFSYAGRNATTWSIGDLSGWDTSNVKDMGSMFKYAGYNATTWNSIGNLKVYASSSDEMFSSCSKAKGTLTIYSNPTYYYAMFNSAATEPGSGITVNYSKNTTNIDAMIATKSTNSNVVKGVQID